MLLKHHTWTRCHLFNSKQESSCFNWRMNFWKSEVWQSSDLIYIYGDDLGGKTDFKNQTLALMSSFFANFGLEK
jgi:hypothetical protein